MIAQAKPPTMPPEHNFNVTREQWEQTVFLNAAHFVVILVIPRESRARQNFPTFPQALHSAGVIARGREDGRKPMIYAVTASGRSVMLSEADYPRLLKLWEEKHP